MFFSAERGDTRRGAVGTALDFGGLSVRTTFGPKTTLRGRPTLRFGAGDADGVASCRGGVTGVTTSFGLGVASEVCSGGSVLGMTGSTGNADDVGVAGLSGA